MSTYVMSDIHGEAALFHAMLEQIKFCHRDDLYIIGDVIDRGSGGIALIKEIMETKNMHMLLGNHEYMMLSYYSDDATETDIRRWNKNGNAPTKEAFDRLTVTEKNEILSFLSNLSTNKKIDVEKNRFYFVHGFPAETVYDRVWNRPTYESENPIDGRTLVVGHTPVLNISVPQESRDEIKRTMAENGEHPKILHTPNFIDIDCGCSYDEPLKTLGCFRLEDMAEFYTYTAML